MDIKELIRVARRRWKSIIAIFVISMIIGAVVSMTTTPIYQSTARVFFSAKVDNNLDSYFANAIFGDRVKSYAQLATSREVMTTVIDDLDLDTTPSELAPTITSAVAAETVIIQIQARNPNARLAQRITQATAEALRDYVIALEAPGKKGDVPVQATLTDPAEAADDPITPRTGLNLAVAALVGLLLGFAFAISRELLDPKVTRPRPTTAR